MKHNMVAFVQFGMCFLLLRPGLKAKLLLGSALRTLGSADASCPLKHPKALRSLQNAEECHTPDLIKRETSLTGRPNQTQRRS